MTSGHPRLAGLAVAALVAAAGLVGLSGGPASAALCSGHGVNVVVDYHALGGGVLKGCDTSGAGKTANKVFPAAGYKLDYAQRQAGFVCRVNGKPASDPCVNTSPANAYWGLYWSDGKSGTWTYATSGVGSVSVPDGGFVALSWQNGGPNDPPGTSPVGVKPSPKPTPKPHPTTKPAKPTKKATATATATKAAAPSSSVAASAKTKASASATASASASSTASPSSASAGVLPPTASDSASPDAATPTATQLASSEPDTGGLPLWVPGAVVVALGAATGGVLWWRRSGRRSGA